jgi:hypothetical protein
MKGSNHGNKEHSANERTSKVFVYLTNNVSVIRRHSLDCGLLQSRLYDFGWTTLHSMKIFDLSAVGG